MRERDRERELSEKINFYYVRVKTTIVAAQLTNHDCLKLSVRCPHHSQKLRSQIHNQRQLCL